MRVLVTGAYGSCGTAVLDHLGDRDGYEFVCLDRAAPPAAYDDYPFVEGDIADYAAVQAAFDGVDAAVHLAAIPGEGPWPVVRENNVEGVRNVLEAACRAGVESFVFASTNHVVGGYEDEHAPALYERGHGLTVDRDAPRRPDSYYGASKAFGEDLGRYYVEYRDAPDRFYALRIGNVSGPEEDTPYEPAESAVERGEFDRDDPEYERTVNRMKAVWCSRRDFAALVDCCLRDESVAHDVFYAVSGNERRWFDIDHARAVLGYDPADDGDAVPPPDEGEGGGGD